MRGRWLWIAPVAIVGLAAFLAIGGFVVQWLWNWLLPPLFGWHTITFWQALGLLALCRILFGGFGMSGGRGRRGSAEERAHFRQHVRDRIRQRVREQFGGGASEAADEGGAVV